MLPEVLQISPMWKCVFYLEAYYSSKIWGLLGVQNVNFMLIIYIWFLFYSSHIVLKPITAGMPEHCYSIKILKLIGRLINY